MCGRYHLGDEDQLVELRQIIDAMNRGDTGLEIKTSGEVFPTDTVPVLATSRSRKPAAFAMQWGYTLPDGRRVINARSETAQTRPMFAEGMAQHRCAVPGMRYFEWDRSSPGRDKYAIRPADDGLMYMAGIYRLEQRRPVFAILTRAPADSIAFIHDRMPVLLSRAQAEAWIDPASDPLLLLDAALGEVRFERVAPEAEQVHMMFQ